MIGVSELESVLRKRLAGFEALTTCERLSAGASRETYRLAIRVSGRERVFALRRASGDGVSAMGEGPGLGAEAKLFAAARKSGVPGPAVVLHLAPEDGLGAGFMMDWVDGETLGGRIARSEAFSGVRPQLARQCGEILARLHAVDVKAAGLGGVLEELSPEHAVRRTHAAYLVMDTAQPMIDFTARWLLDNLPKHRPSALVHGDFRNGNLVVDPLKGVAAVLDWELAHIGDPMRDLGWLCTRSWRFGAAPPVGGFGEHEELFAGYEAAGGSLDRDAVQFWEVFGSFWWSVGCLSMAQSFRNGSEASLERPVIGRRSSECQIDCVNMLIPGPAQAAAAETVSLSSTDLPRSDELLRGVAAYLRAERADSLKGRDAFLSRVGANAIDIVIREIALGAAAERLEEGHLRALTGGAGDASVLRARLCEMIRDGSISRSSPDLHQYLRDSVLAQVMIDQPEYAGAREALARANA